MSNYNIPKINYPGTSFCFKIEGNSMFPFFQKGDVVVVDLKEKDFSVGDVVVFLQKDRIIAHRLVYKNGKTLITKGDNNIYTDKPLQKNEVLGKVIKIYRGNQNIHISDFYNIYGFVYLQEIEKLVQAFRQYDIDYIFLKGVFLHLYYERDFPKHFAKDYDILVKPKDREKLKVILKDVGYQKVDPTFRIPFSQKEAFLYYKNTEVGVRIFLDLHFSINFLMTQIKIPDFIYNTSLMYRFTEDLFNNSEMVEIKDVKIKIIRPDYLIVYLSLHLFHHNFRGWAQYKLLNQIINEVVKRDKRIWKKIENIAEKYSVKTFIWPVFVLLNKLYFLDIPKGFLRKTQKKVKSRGISDLFDDPYKVFVSDESFFSGITRVFTILDLSKASTFQKIQFFLSPRIIFIILWVVFMKVKVIMKAFLQRFYFF